MMPERETSCPYGTDSDIDARYLAGALSAVESEAFEEHYFACDRCFGAVQRGAEIRAAMSLGTSEVSPEAEPRVIPIERSVRRFSTWRPAMAAAALVIFALGIRQVIARRPLTGRTAGLPSPSIDAPRGARPPFTLTSHATSAVLVAAWSPPPGARSYRVRLLAIDGSLLFERETADTSVMLSSELIRDGTPVYWEVQALDALRSVVATTPVVRAQTSPGPP
jgi:Putative zinc-finger